MTTVTLGQRLRDLRRKRQMTVRALADSVGTTPGYISRLETRDEVPSAELLCRLATIFDVDPTGLLRIAKMQMLGKTEQQIAARHQEALLLYRKSR